MTNIIQTNKFRLNNVQVMIHTDEIKRIIDHLS